MDWYAVQLKKPVDQGQYSLKTLMEVAKGITELRVGLFHN